MTREISNSVGLGGVNVIIDVMIVEELLNGVPPEKGGPEQDFLVHGENSRELELAIHKFQRHHFGWKGADARVDPGHQTIRKLNEVQEGPPKSGTFLLKRPILSKPELDPGRPEDWFILVELVRPGIRRESIFWFGPTWQNPPAIPGRAAFVAQSTEFLRCNVPMTLKEIEGPAKIEQNQFQGRFMDFSQLSSHPPHAFLYYAIINAQLKVDHPLVKMLPVGHAVFYTYEGLFRHVA